MTKLRIIHLYIYQLLLLFFCHYLYQFFRTVKTKVNLYGKKNFARRRRGYKLLTLYPVAVHICQSVKLVWANYKIQMEKNFPPRACTS